MRPPTRDGTQQSLKRKTRSTSNVAESKRGMRPSDTRKAAKQQPQDSAPGMVGNREDLDDEESSSGPPPRKSARQAAEKSAGRATCKKEGGPQKGRKKNTSPSEGGGNEKLSGRNTRRSKPVSAAPAALMEGPSFEEETKDPEPATVPKLAKGPTCQEGGENNII